NIPSSSHSLGCRRTRGIMQVESAGEFPRNRDQVYNINRQAKRQKVDVPLSTGDPLLQVLAKAKEEQQGLRENLFIREIPLFPEPITLPLLMTKYNKDTSGVLAYGTDGEENLFKAMSQVFVDAKHLRCDIHLRDNVKRKLSELGISGSVADEIVCDIFGKVLGEVTEGGLVDCT
ncbi:unnamed protein product, partial [Porites lobata]